MYMYTGHTQYGLNISPLKSYTATATHCNTLQHTATHCNTLQHTATHYNTIQNTTTLYKTLPHSETPYTPLQHSNEIVFFFPAIAKFGNTATHCNTLQHTAHHQRNCILLSCRCNSLQRSAKHCNTQYSWAAAATLYNALQRLQHNATHCNTLQLTSEIQYSCAAAAAQGSFCLSYELQHTATHRNTLQHTATHQWNPILLSCRCRARVILPILYSSLCFWTLHVQKKKCMNKYVSIFENANPHDICFTGWQRCIGRLKLQVTFRKRATKYRSLLRKITYQDKASYGSSPPCTSFSWTFMFQLWTFMFQLFNSVYSCAFIYTWVHVYKYVYICIYIVGIYVYQYAYIYTCLFVYIHIRKRALWAYKTKDIV